MASGVSEGPSESVEPSWPVSEGEELKVDESFEIILSYVRKEASKYALLLADALERKGHTVFLDIHCFKVGNDWQDVLNKSIYNCSLFVPLITMQYGQTRWTNRELKLADVLSKPILPVNFNCTWPPKCLGIQLAATQYIPGNKSLGHQEVTPESFTKNTANIIAIDILERCRKDTSSHEVISPFEATAPLLSRQNIENDGEVSTPSSAELKPPVLNNSSRRRLAIRSYASDLPESVSKIHRMALLESREGKPLVVISCCQKQKEFAQELILHMEENDYEAWCSCDITDECIEERSFLFQNKVNEAGAVIFILSTDFAEDEFCKQQVYYCEQRKRIIPLIYKPLEMPSWMATLIGTSTFISCESKSYLTPLMDRIKTVLNPMKAENELKRDLRQKMELSKLCVELKKKLPKGKHVYISGGAKFFSRCGQAICQEVGKELARDERIVLITGGFYGVGETVGRSFYEEREHMGAPHNVCHVVPVKDDQDKSYKTRQNPDLTFCKVPYGDTYFFGNSVRQREMLIPKVVDLCVLIEGGPGAAFEAQQFTWNGHQVIPVRVTCGAAGGLFNVPSSIFVCPPSVSDSDWSVLGDDGASSSEIGLAVAQIISMQTNPENPMIGIQSKIHADVGVREWVAPSRGRGGPSIKPSFTSLWKKKEVLTKMKEVLTKKKEALTQYCEKKFQ